MLLWIESIMFLRTEWRASKPTIFQTIPFSVWIFIGMSRGRAPRPAAQVRAEHQEHQLCCRVRQAWKEGYTCWSKAAVKCGRLVLLWAAKGTMIPYQFPSESSSTVLVEIFLKRCLWDRPGFWESIERNCSVLDKVGRTDLVQKGIISEFAERRTAWRSCFLLIGSRERDMFMEEGINGHSKSCECSIRLVTSKAKHRATTKKFLRGTSLGVKNKGKKIKTKRDRDILTYHSDSFYHDTSEIQNNVPRAWHAWIDIWIEHRVASYTHLQNAKSEQWLRSGAHWMHTDIIININVHWLRVSRRAMIAHDQSSQTSTSTSIDHAGPSARWLRADTSMQK